MKPYFDCKYPLPVVLVKTWLLVNTFSFSQNLTLLQYLQRKQTIPILYLNILIALMCLNLKRCLNNSIQYILRPQCYITAELHWVYLFQNLVLVHISCYIMDILEHEIIFTETKSFGHKTFEYDFRTCTPKLSNQNKVFVRYSFVIGWVFFSTSTKSCSDVLWPQGLDFITCHNGYL